MHPDDEKVLTELRAMVAEMEGDEIFMAWAREAITGFDYEWQGTKLHLYRAWCAGRASVAGLPPSSLDSEAAPSPARGDTGWWCSGCYNHNEPGRTSCYSCGGHLE